MFVALCDVESSTGGGQTIYRQIFRRYPQIDFTYLLDHEPGNLLRPPNVHGLRLGPRYVRNSAVTSLLMECYCWSNTIAETLRGHSFDVIEIPDFMSDYCLLPAALAERDITTSIAVALHGRSSRTRELEWPPVGRVDPERLQAEDLLFGTSDVRYGISPFYLDEWKTISSLPTQFVNPLAWLSFPPLQQPVRTTHAPNLHFVGRTERRKGPDLFVEALWRLPRSTYSESSIIGPSVPITANLDSNAYLRWMIRSRQLNTRVVGQKTPIEVLDVFAARSIVVLPSRYDTFNLVALESLLAGCPTVIGSGAGACQFLADHLPSIPLTRFDVNDLDAAANQIGELIHRYDDAREELAAAVRSLAENVPLPDLEAIYARRQRDPVVRKQAVQLYQDLQRSENTTRPSVVRRIKQWVARSPRITKALLTVQASLTRRDRPTLSKQTVGSALRSWDDFDRSRRMVGSTPSEKQAKLVALQCTTTLFGRRQIWAELAMELLGTEHCLTGAVYALRALRLSADNLDELLQLATASLESGGFKQEATLARLLYQKQAESVREERVAEWLQKCEEQTRTISDIPMTIIEDRRGATEPLVSIVVAIDSMQLPGARWWDQFDRQSLMKQKRAEIIVVLYKSGDHNSPSSGDRTDLNPLNCPAVSIRLEQPSTVGQAWNQGLRFARASYVTLLTSCEVLLPFALERLAGELDTRPDLDWIQSQTLEIECDSRGQYLRDLRYFDRTVFDSAMIHLDWNSASRAGTLYRRSIHNRCGYFDPSFRAAADLEFIQRNSGKIRSAVWPETFSLIQIESDRTDLQKLDREIESLRAWDVFRTVAGIQKLDNSQPDQLKRAIQVAWAYRPVASNRSEVSMSGDVEYASRLARVAASRRLELPDGCAEHLERLLSLYRRLDLGGWRNLATARADVCRIWITIRREWRKLAATLGDPPNEPYFHDERFERDRLLAEKFISGITLDGRHD